MAGRGTTRCFLHLLVRGCCVREACPAAFHLHAPGSKHSSLHRLESLNHIHFLTIAQAVAVVGPELWTPRLGRQSSVYPGSMLGAKLLQTHLP